MSESAIAAQNRELAYKLLAAKLRQMEAKRDAEINALRAKSDISFGSQIRSYV